MKVNEISKITVMKLASRFIKSSIVILAFLGGRVNKIKYIDFMVANTEEANSSYFYRQISLSFRINFDLVCCCIGYILFMQ